MEQFYARNKFEFGDILSRHFHGYQAFHMQIRKTVTQFFAPKVSPQEPARKRSLGEVLNLNLYKDSFLFVDSGFNFLCWVFEALM
jgi:hypothetical protein